ncbi:MAG: terminase, partial [Candidatus Marinimicrobia bacterium]|nr:terminase [Candidatus Neomarinimicrobiota bacterium]
MEIKLMPKQSYCLNSPSESILYGGARMGGKSHLLRAMSIIYASSVPKIQVCLLRRSYQELTQNHLQGVGGYPDLLEDFIDKGLCTINYSKMRIDFKNGSMITLRHLQYESDLSSIQGSAYQLILFDEAVTFSWHMFQTVRACLRLGPLKVPKDFPYVVPRIVAASNPGGAHGDAWKKHFVDHGDNIIWRAPPHEGGMLTQYVPAKLEDNSIALENDPNYRQRLMGMGDPAIVEAHLNGDWSIIQGGAFSDLWSPISHVVEPFLFSGMNTELYGNLGTVNKEAFFFSKAYDYGSSAP